MTSTSEITTFSAVDKYTFPISDSVALSAYLDSKPQNMRTADLREGILRRGREFLKESLEWVGLDYELSPENDSFKYGIEILGHVQLR